jgi:oligopeptide/dipeptide ABC transporter ATP-binding protein
MMDTAPPVLDIDGLVKEFVVDHDHVLTAVNRVSFQLAPGETLALVGESGSGKTTVGRSVLRLLEPTHGTVVFKGEDITHLSAGRMRHLRPRMQVVFQDPQDSLDPQMRIGTIVGEPLREFTDADRAARDRRVAALLEEVRLDADTARAYPHELTAGGQQRVAIARALATEPDLLVLDEPTSSLDPIARGEIIGLLQGLQRRHGTAFLFISHDLVTVRQLSQRIAVMYLGEIVEQGPTETVFDNPRHPYTRGLLASALSVERRMRSDRLALAGEIPSPVDLPRGCFLASRCPFVLDGCRDRHPELVEVDPGHAARCFRVSGELEPIGTDTGERIAELAVAGLVGPNQYDERPKGERDL